MKIDMVNKPPHYRMGDIECIDAIEASMTRGEFLAYLKGQVFKYLWRYRWKKNPIEDVRKAKFYMDRLAEKMASSPKEIGDDEEYKKYCSYPQED